MPDVHRVCGASCSSRFPSHSDRYGALYADIVFAKDALVAICRDDGVRFVPYENFDDVRAALEVVETLPGPVAPERCPGWHTA